MSIDRRSSLATIALAFAMLVGCDHAVEQATEHLRSLGFKAVACSPNGRDATTCIADDSRFHCVTSDAVGCSDPTIACERFYLEKPAP